MVETKKNIIKRFKKRINFCLNLLFFNALCDGLVYIPK